MSRDIFNECLNAILNNEEAALATVISTSGSTPAANLSKMLVKSSGMVTIGTVGGGCMEAEVIKKAAAVVRQQQPRVCYFQLDDDDIAGGHICGGRLEILIEPLKGSMSEVFWEIVSIRSRGENAAMVTSISHRGPTSKALLKSDGSTVGIAGRSEPNMMSHATEVLQSGKPKTVKLGESVELIIEPIIGYPTLFIFGAGHISLYLAKIASMVGFKVVVLDDREKYLNKGNFPTADEIICTSFDSAFDKLKINQASYIVIVTRGHAHDEQVLEKAVKTNANYVGMIGSKQKVETVFSNLGKKGITDKLLQNVYAPVGININSRTPEEIALSIAAQLVKAKNSINVDD